MQSGIHWVATNVLLNCYLIIMIVQEAQTATQVRWYVMGKCTNMFTTIIKTSIIIYIIFIIIIIIHHDHYP